MAREGKKRLVAYLDKEIHRRLKRFAFENEMAMTDIVSELIRRFLEGDIFLEEDPRQSNR